MKEQAIEWLSWDEEYPLPKKSIEIMIDRLLVKYDLLEKDSHGIND